MQIGKTLREQRAEERGLIMPSLETVSLIPVYPAMGKVPVAYGRWCHPTLDAHGGWIASAIDLLRFLRGLKVPGYDARPLGSDDPADDGLSESL